MTRLIIWRHGQSEWNHAGRFQGQIDTPLSELGRQQAAVAAGRLVTVQPHALVSSDLARAADTAAALAAVTGLPVTTDPRLRERFFGQWQGLMATDIAKRWPGEYARYRAGEPSPGCDIEHLDELTKRVTAALRDVADRFAGSTVVVSAHGAAARAGTAGMLGWPPQVAATLGALDNCHWVDLRLDAVRGWRLHAHNVGA